MNEIDKNDEIQFLPGNTYKFSTIKEKLLCRICKKKVEWPEEDDDKVKGASHCGILYRIKRIPSDIVMYDEKVIDR